MTAQSLGEFLGDLRDAGFSTKAILGDEEMAQLTELLNHQALVVDTPSDELRYIEGLFHLPLGSIRSFRVSARGAEPDCACGRRLTALDIVHTAYVKRLHDREMIRDTLLALENICEVSEDGRHADCYQCGRAIVMDSYFTDGYAYAVRTK